METINKTKKKIDSFYSNKIFRFVFFVACIVLVIYNYSNIKEGINPKTIGKNSNLDIPQKINTIRKAQDIIFAETKVQSENNEKKQEEIENIKIVEQYNKMEQEKSQKRTDALRKEFTTSTAKKNSRKLVIGDMAEVKMIVTGGDNFNIPIEPIVMSVKVNKQKENIFGRYLIGKRVGEIVNIPLKVFLDRGTFQKEFEKVKKNQNLKDVDINFDAMANSNVLYRIKIIKLKK